MITAIMTVMIRDRQKQKKQDWAKVVLDPECPTFSESLYFVTYKSTFLKFQKAKKAELQNLEQKLACNGRKSRNHAKTEIFPKFCCFWWKAGEIW